MIPSKPELQLKPMDLILDQKKMKEVSCESETSSKHMKSFI